MFANVYIESASAMDECFHVRMKPVSRSTVSWHLVRENIIR